MIFTHKFLKNRPWWVDFSKFCRNVLVYLHQQQPSKQVFYACFDGCNCHCWKWLISHLKKIDFFYLPLSRCENQAINTRFIAHVILRAFHLHYYLKQGLVIASSSQEGIQLPGIQKIANREVLYCTVLCCGHIFTW